MLLQATVRLKLLHVILVKIGTKAQLYAFPPERLDIVVLEEQAEPIAEGGTAKLLVRDLQRQANLGDLYAESGQTSQGSFSAVSKPKFASKYAFESSRRDLHNALL